MTIMPTEQVQENFDEELEVPFIWGIFYISIEANQFVKTILGVSADKQKLIAYANRQAEGEFFLNSHFDKSKGAYRVEDMADYYGAKSEVFRSFPFFIGKIVEIT